MSRRTSIVKALAAKLNEQLDGVKYTTNIFNNVYPKLKFWDEVQDFPSIYITAGMGARDYQLAGFIWGLLNVSIKMYVNSEEDAQMQLEQLLEDVSACIDANRVLVYDDTYGYATTEILITTTTTDEGLLRPYGVGELNLQVRYALQ
ncbi:hypothetical protein UFOVP218_31 [uncultured Caudovirales phage]|uniref:Uncharacterized protein n=1 Tax=uncultured Caudovirales phage TaxID=2100421 RepID=A0A6J7WKJ3_9CAUD|nr:hypothetical protein UFOVP218_31 [uncultured Caudovirales phage]